MSTIPLFLVAGAAKTGTPYVSPSFTNVRCTLELQISMTAVSIITVSYNSAETIRDTIESVRRQTYSHIEYIIVDGSSTDGTVDILRENEEVIDRWISEPDDGIYDAMNKGIRMSTGDIIGILNSDDWYEPEAVETAVRAFEEHDGTDLVHGAMNVWNEKNDLHAKYGRKDHLPVEFVAPFNHPACFVRRRAYKDIGLFALDLPTAADYDFMLRFLKSSRKSCYVDYILTNFRQGGATSQYTFSPYSQIWTVLQRNNRPRIKLYSGLIFRGIRDVLVLILKNLKLDNVRKQVGSFAPYKK